MNDQCSLPDSSLKSPYQQCEGAWARLEDQERSLSKVEGVDAVYVATGPLYERDMGSLPGTNKVHTIPSGYW